MKKMIYGLKYNLQGGNYMEHKIKKITFRVTSEELKIIEDKVKKSNLKKSEYMRHSALNKKIVVIEDLKKFIKVLRGIGNNINQLTILSHQGKINIIEENDLIEVKEKVNEIWQLLNSLMAKTKKKQD